MAQWKERFSALEEQINQPDKLESPSSLIQSIRPPCEAELKPSHSPRGMNGHYTTVSRVKSYTDAHAPSEHLDCGLTSPVALRLRTVSESKSLLCNPSKTEPSTIIFLTMTEVLVIYEKVV